MRRSFTESNWRELARVTKSNRIKPSPPMGVRYDAVAGVLSWEAPTKKDNITHYRIYAENENKQSLVREVSAGQLQIADLLEATTVLVTAYNSTFDLESPPAILLQAGVTPPSSGGGTGSVTFIHSLLLTTATTSLVEPTLDDNGQALSSAIIGDRMVVFVQQDGTGNRKLTLGAEFMGRGGGLITTPGAYTVFEYVKTSMTNPMWWQVGAAVGYA